MSEDINQPITIQPKKSRMMPVLFGIILAFLISVSGFLAYQNYQLKQKMLEVSVIPSASPTIALTIVPVEVADPTAGWKIYLDPYEQYSFRYPQTYSLDTAARPYLNRNITWSFENNSFSSCRGDCPVVDSSSKTSLGGKSATKITGYIGSVGGNVPQSYVAYEVVSGNKYFIFQIEALPFVMSREEYVQYNQSDIQPIRSEDLRMFDQILSTFKFLDQTVNTSNWKTYTNNTFGFSVKYNPAFKPNEITGGIQQLALIGFGSMKNNGFDIEVTTGDTIGYYKNRITDQGEKIDKEEKVIVDGTSATKLTFKQVIVIDKLDISKIIITKNNRDYIITALASDIDQILSTFKFVN